MPREKRPMLEHDERIRADIEILPIIECLTQFVKGEIEMTSPQVGAALGLLKKALPDLSTAEHAADVAQHHTISAEPMSNDEWEAAYCEASEAVPSKSPSDRRAGRETR